MSNEKFIRVKPETHRRLKILAAKQEKSLIDMIEDLVRKQEEREVLRSTKQKTK
jgi:predicted HicB family RNase H-like nuclease